LAIAPCIGRGRVRPGGRHTTPILDSLIYGRSGNLVPRRVRTYVLILQEALHHHACQSLILFALAKQLRYNIGSCMCESFF